MAQRPCASCQITDVVMLRRHGWQQVKAGILLMYVSGFSRESGIRFYVFVQDRMKEMQAYVVSCAILCTKKGKIHSSFQICAEACCSALLQLNPTDKETLLLSVRGGCRSCKNLRLFCFTSDPHS